MASLTEIRAKYPQYQDMSDQEFADAFYTKYYSDVPRDEFNTQLGITPRGFMDAVRSDGVMSAVGDYATGTYENMTDPQQWKDALWRGSHDSQGRNIGEQLMDPMSAFTAAGDQAAIAGDTLSAGLYPKFIDALTGTTSQTDAVREAEERAGTAGTGMKMAATAAIPSRTASATVGPLAKAAGFGAEGAALSGADTLLRGGESRDVLASMALGGGLSSLGSLGARFLPGGSERGIPRKAPYPDDASLFKESSRTARNTVEGKDLATRTEKVKDLRLAATKGQPGLKELDKKQVDINKAAQKYKSKEPYPYEERLKVSEAAHGTTPSNLWGSAARIGGNVLKAGGLPLSWMSGGKSAVLAAGAEEAARAFSSGAGRKQIDEIADYIRNNGLGQMPTSVSPELANQLRDYVARTMRDTGREKK